MHSLLGRSGRSMKRGYYVADVDVMSVGFVRRVLTEDKTGGHAAHYIVNTGYVVQSGRKSETAV